MARTLLFILNLTAVVQKLQDFCNLCKLDQQSRFFLYLIANASIVIYLLHEIKNYSEIEGGRRSAPGGATFSYAAECLWLEHWFIYLRRISVHCDGTCNGIRIAAAFQRFCGCDHNM